MRVQRGRLSLREPPPQLLDLLRGGSRQACGLRKPLLGAGQPTAQLLSRPALGLGCRDAAIRMLLQPGELPAQRLGLLARLRLCGGAGRLGDLMSLRGL